MVKAAEKAGTIPDMVTICTAFSIPTERGWRGLRNTVGRLYAKHREYDSGTRRRLLWLHEKFTTYVFRSGQ